MYEQVRVFASPIDMRRALGQLMPNDAAVSILVLSDEPDLVSRVLVIACRQGCMRRDHSIPGEIPRILGTAPAPRRPESACIRAP